MKNKNAYLSVLSAVVFCVSFQSDFAEAARRTTRKNVTILPTVQWQVAGQTVSESVGSARVVAVLSATSASSVSIPFSLSGSATAPSDFASVSGSITIPAGTLSGSVAISIVNDTAVESTETFALSMGTPTGANRGTNAIHTITITDDDSAPVVTLPVITSFSVPSTSSSLTVPVTSFTATHSSPITAYMINEGSTTPLLTNVRWQATPPTTYVALTPGTKVLYAWARDAAGNVSRSVSRSVAITLPAPSPTPTATVAPTPSPTPTATVAPPPAPAPTSTSTPAPSPVYSKIYYLSTTGSDAGTGSSTSPWRTLAHACTQATGPSAVIHIRAGTYNETARCNLAVGVSIEGEGTSSTIVRTTYAATGTSDAAIRMHSSTHTNGNQSISGFTMDGNNLVSYRAIAANFRNNVTVHHMRIVNFNANAMFFRGSTAAWDVLPPVFATGNKFHDNVVVNCGTRSALESAHMRINGQKDMLVYNNSFDQTSRPTGQNGNILGGEWNKALKIYNNTFTKNSDEGPEWNFFFELWHWEGGGEINGNTFRGAATMDIVDVTPSTYGYGLKIYNNKYLSATPVPWAAHGVQAINIELRQYAVGVHIYDNYIKNFPNGVWFDIVVNTSEGYTFNKVSDCHVYRNLMENIGSINGGGHAMWMNTYGSNPNVTWDNINIHSNTITGGTTTNWGNGILWSAGGSQTNINIRNNILQGFKERPIAFKVGVAGATMSNVTVEHNLYYLNGTNTANYGTVPMTNRIDRNNVVGNPLFINPLAGNFAPAAGSVACSSSVTGGYVGAFPCQ